MFFMPRGTRWPGEFKQKVVEDLINSKMSYRETMKKYGLTGKMSIQQWERIYLEEGPEGLYIDRRGLKSTGRPRKMPKNTEEDLLAEVQRLRVENDYLKKLNALVSQRVQREKKRKS